LTINVIESYYKMDILNFEPKDLTLKQMLDVYVIPEIAQRKESGKIPENFELTSFQILFYPHLGRNEIRFNEQCKIVAVTELNKAVNKGDPIFVDDIEKIKEIRLDSSDDPNCGHMTYFMLGDHLYHSYDFRYNRKTIGEYLELAQQFIESAEAALNKQHYEAFIDNLFSAVEITAKSQLIIHPDLQLMKKSTHKSIKTKFHQYGHLGNVNSSYVSLLKKFTSLRSKARYSEGEKPRHDQAIYIDDLATAKQFIQYVKESAK
jgi:uncharacterized protein (UPF0332 family)